MKRTFLSVFTLFLCLCLLCGCSGTTVVINDCNCPQNNTTPNTNTNTPSTDTAKGSVKTGLAVVTSVADSTNAMSENLGEVKFDITIAAVTVDENGVIASCALDSVPASVQVTGSGAIASDIHVDVPTKNELGENYGMVAWGGAIAEWDEQVAALCRFAEGKTVEAFKSGAVNEHGMAPDGSDLASSATIYLGGYVAAIEEAAKNATALGADSGDTLKLVTLNSLKNSTAATAEQNGNAQLDADIAVVTLKDGKITSCLLDSVQAKIAFDATGTITSDLTAPILTKNALGEQYGMVAWGGAKAEWNEQAAAFAAYVTGKTAAEVAGIAVNESTKPADGSDLSSSVTIAVGGFQTLIAKAFAA